MQLDKLRRYVGEGAPPGLDADEAEILAFVEHHFDDESAFRREYMIYAMRNRLMYKGDQWFRSPRVHMASDGYRFQAISRSSNTAFPTPVDNRIAPGVDNEISRLGRKEYEAKVRPDRPLPDLLAAARLGNAVLEYNLEQMQWPEIREGLAHDLIVTGTAIGRSWWDQSATDIMMLSSPDAAFCPSCSTKFSSRTILAAHTQMGLMGPNGPQPMLHTDMLSPVDKTEFGGSPLPMPEMAMMQVCPMCQEVTPLQDYAPGLDELGQQDPFGVGYGQAVPRGEDLIEQVLPEHFYPENGGVGLEPHQCRVWGSKIPRDLDWIVAHYPEVSDWIKPDPSEEILKNHPILGHSLYTGAQRAPASNCYTNHANVVEVVIQPIQLPGLEQGRHIVVVNKKLVSSTELVLQAEGPNGQPVEVERVTYAAARAKRIPGVFWGGTPVNDAVPLQRDLNEMWAIQKDIMERGIPWGALPAGSEIYVKEGGGAFRWFEYDTNGQPWDPKNAIVNAGGVTGSNYLPVIESKIRSIELILGPQPVQAGENPTGVHSALQLQLLAEEAAQKHGPRERALVKLFERLFEAHLKRTWALRTETTSYVVKDGTHFEQDEYNGADLIGQCKVKVETQGTFDKNVKQAQGVRDALTMQPPLYDVTKPNVRAKALKLMDLPAVDEQESKQTQTAEEAWENWSKRGQLPAVDKDLHEAGIWFETLGSHWLDDEAKERQQAAQWNQILRQLAGWEDKYHKADQRDLVQRQTYENVPPEQWGMVYQQMQAAWEQLKAAEEQAAQIGAPPGNPLPPRPEPPPQQGFLPLSPETRVYTVMSQMLPPEAVQMAGDVLAMYAVIQAYRLLVEAKQQEMMAMQAGPAPAPGA